MAFITTSEELTEAGVPNVNLTIKPLLPYLDNAFDQLRPLLGAAFAQELLDQEASPNQSEAYLAIRHLLVQAVAQIGFATYLPFAEVTIANDGVTISAVEGRKNAPERQIRDLRNSLLEMGWAYVETLLRYLSEDGLIDDYPLYADHIADQLPSLLPSATTFSGFYPIFNSRLTYEALRPTISRLEEDTLMPYLADRWEQLTARPGDAATAKLQRLLRTWLAFQTIVEAIPSLLVRVSGGGVRVIWGTATATGSLEYFTPATEAQLGRLLDSCTQHANDAWQAALGLITPTTEDRGSGLLDNTGSTCFFM